MNYKNVFKRETKVIAYVVIALTLVVIGSSYALFMQVHNNTTNQVVTAGSLTIAYDQKNDVNPDLGTNNSCLTPMDDDTGKASGCDFKLSITNNGTLAMDFDLMIYNASGASVELKDIKYHLTSQTTNVKAGQSSGQSETRTIENAKLLSELTAKNGETNKKVLTSGVINPGETIAYALKLWIQEEAPEELIGKKVSLSLDVAGTVHEDATNSVSADIDEDDAAIINDEDISEDEKTQTEAKEEVITNEDSTPVTTDTQNSKETETQE